MGRRRYYWLRPSAAGAAGAEILIATAGPMTGVYDWFGEQYQRGTALAIADPNAAGRVLGHVELIVGDDFCDPDQAVALARKLISDGVAFVNGHWCSHSATPASKIYEAAGVLMIAPGAISAKLTHESGPTVFRVCGRDDRQGNKVADYLADHRSGKKIAILHYGTTFGTGLECGHSWQIVRTPTPAEGPISAGFSSLPAYVL